MTLQENEPVFVCLLNAIPQEKRAFHQDNTQKIMKAVQETQELDTGYALRLPHTEELLQTVSEFLRYESLCCPFLHFQLEIRPYQGFMRLTLTSTRDAKEFLRDEGFIPHQQ